jgi:hypothetical protein
VRGVFPESYVEARATFPARCVEFERRRRAAWPGDVDLARAWRAAAALHGDPLSAAKRVLSPNAERACMRGAHAGDHVSTRLFRPQAVTSQATSRARGPHDRDGARGPTI